MAGLCAAAALLGALALLSTACSVELPGRPGVAPVVRSATGPAAVDRPATAAPVGPRSLLDADPISDECLLDASQVGSLVGTAVTPPAESVLRRPDGSVGRSCVAFAGQDPAAMINVYRVRTGSPATYLRAGDASGRHELPELGAAAVVIPTSAGPILQVAGPTYLVTILVTRGEPSDDAWRAAGTAALTDLPG